MFSISNQISIQLFVTNLLNFVFILNFIASSLIAIQNYQLFYSITIIPIAIAIVIQWNTRNIF